MSCHWNYTRSVLQTGLCFFLYIILSTVSGTGYTEAKTSPLTLSVSHDRTGDILYSRSIAPGAILRLSWIHSVELTPWEEYYQISSAGKIILKKTRFQSYGAGVPEYGGVFRKELKWMIHEDINTEFPAIKWIHSRTAKFQLHVDGTVYLTPDSLPHHEPLKLTITSHTP